MATLVYTSSIQTGDILFGDCSLYAYLDSIEQAAITNYADAIPVDGYENCSIEIGPVNAVGAEGDPNFGYIGIGPVGITASLLEYNSGEVSIGPLWGKGAEGESNFGVASIGPVTAFGEEDSIVIDYNAGNISIGPVWVASYEGYLDENTGDVEIGPVGSVGAEGDVSIGFINIGPVSVFGYAPVLSYLAMLWPDFTVSGIYASFGPADITWPARVLHAEGGPSDGTVDLVWPTRTLTAYSGGSIELTWPVRTLSVAGTLQVIGTIELTWPERVLTAESFANDLGTAELIWPTKTLTAYGSGYAALEWPARALTVAGTLEIVGTAALAWPARSLTADGLLGSVGSITLTWPTRVLTATGLTGGLGTITLVWPTRVLVATDSGVVTETTYAINLSTGAITQLLLGAFEKLVTAHGRLYGLRDGVLIYLGGDTDQGTDIPVTIRFAPQQFGTNLAKRIDGKVYLNVREDDGITLTVIEDETRSWSYPSPTDTAPAMGTHPIHVGRGLTFHSLGLIIENCNGGRLAIGGLEIPIIPLSRRPK